MEIELPCTPCANWYSAGDTLKIYEVKWGHVFAYWSGPAAPNIQFPLCIGCGEPFHKIREEKERQG